MKTAISLLLLAVLAIAGCSQPAETPIGSTDNPTVILKLSSTNFKYSMDGVDNPTLRVKQGDIVRVELTVQEGFHDFVVDELNAKTSQVNAVATTSTTFSADTPGTYEYYCSVGKHREMGMKGTIIVES